MPQVSAAYMSIPQISAANTSIPQISAANMSMTRVTPFENRRNEKKVMSSEHCRAGWICVVGQQLQASPCFFPTLHKIFQ